MASIMNSPCWVRATQIADPDFRRAYDLYVDERDKFGGHLMRQSLTVSAEDFHIALVNSTEMSVFSPNTTSAPEEGSVVATNGFPYMAAIPFTVTPEVCEASRDGTGARHMAAGAITALMDMITSFHIILATFPKKNGHVSLSMQVNHMAPLLCGKSYVAISRIDKMGRRIVFTNVDYVDPILPCFTSAEGEDGAPLPMTTTAELMRAVKTVDVLANMKHIKSMLSFS